MIWYWMVKYLSMVDGNYYLSLLIMSDLMALIWENFKKLYFFNLTTNIKTKKIYRKTENEHTRTKTQNNNILSICLILPEISKKINTTNAGAAPEQTFLETFSRNIVQRRRFCIIYFIITTNIWIISHQPEYIYICIYIFRTISYIP
jgi:hypothetical protein